MWKRGITEIVQCFCSRLQFHGFASTNMQSCVLWQKSVSICVFLKTDAGFLLSFQGRNEIDSCEKSDSRMCSSICLFARINIIFHISTLNIAIQFCPLNRFWSQMYNIIWANFSSTVKMVKMWNFFGALLWPNSMICSTFLNCSEEILPRGF